MANNGLSSAAAIILIIGFIMSLSCCFAPILQDFLRSIKIVNTDFREFINKQKIDSGLPFMVMGLFLFFLASLRCIFHTPSIRGCFAYYPYLNSIAYMFLFPLFLGFSIASFVSTGDNKFVFLALALSMGILMIIVNGSNFFKSNRNNTNITDVVDTRGISLSYNLIKNTHFSFKSTMDTVVPLSSCQNLLSKSSREDGYICQPQSSECPCDESDTTTARLMDLQIASSYASAAVGSLYSGYGSAEMVENALLGGARYFHFNVNTVVEKGRVIPIVQFNQNYVPLYDCFQTLHNAIAYKAVHPYVKDGFRSDPLLIHLELNVQSQMLIMDQIAIDIVQLFGNKLCPQEYNYKYVEIATDYPVCLFYEKIIFIVNGDETQGTRLDDLINIRTDGIHSNNVNIYEWSEITTGNSASIISKNANKFSIVRGIEQNMDPTKLIECGCNIIPMNYSPIEMYLIKYLEIFKTCSFIQKKTIS